MSFDRIMGIAKSLGVEERDIKRMGRRGSVNKLIYWILGIIIAIVSFIAGYLIGKRACPATSPHGYPFAVVGLAIPAALKEKRRSKTAILILSILVFLLAIKSQPIFGQAIEYNVYSRK